MQNYYLIYLTGLNGRPEKLPDVCYSWWVLASLKILNRIHWIDKEKLKTFMLACQVCIFVITIQLIASYFHALVANKISNELNKDLYQLKLQIFEQIFLIQMFTFTFPS